MKKIICIMLIPLIILCGMYTFDLYKAFADYKSAGVLRSKAFNRDTGVKREAGEESHPHVYYVYVNGERQKTFDVYLEAVEYAGGIKGASIYENITASWVWDNTPPFELRSEKGSVSFNTFAEAVAASDYGSRDIVYKKTGVIIWEKGYTANGHKIAGVPFISQYPDLDRGCEVTSAAMLLKYNGFDVDKNILADSIAKHENNPYKGFVGDMRSFSKPGYGVYHGPVYDLLSSYMQDGVIDLTGAKFDDLYYILDHDQPVWVVTNSTFAPLYDESFVKWDTDDGPISITYREHSVLVTGYDNEYIYFNDPNALPDEVSKADVSLFISAWEQMDRQAIAASP